ncbi:hypothetical protein K461DRAFT_276196 [Myriangium duriaei CBS 260.36]|uniref:Aminoglycoside phosphotransferase domain-containing protein n=1 Tax=Myriangium duriaei CBS 260.36 TaxID=1168546 RepID=A0A9P4J5L4_9PEZI|nr:hypothetical protein K461DRAFT_276196 [Myriangium duriaei CBS 260.36]
MNTILAPEKAEPEGNAPETAASDAATSETAASAKAASNKTITIRGRTYSLHSTAELPLNFIHLFQNHEDALSHKTFLWKQRKSIVTSIRHILHLRPCDGCHILRTWMAGGFNTCAMAKVTIDDIERKLIFRCPMPHRHAEQHYPGTMDEKLNSEVATYLWIQRNCPDIPIPQLYAFGFADGTQFAHTDPSPVQARLNGPLTSSYALEPLAPPIDTAYILLEYIGPEVGKGRMLAHSWKEQSHDNFRLYCLFRSIARIMLSLARVPQKNIGSLRFNPKDGTVSLANRPMMANTMIWENEGARRVLQPEQVYRTTDSFASDMLLLYDNHFRHDPHAVRKEKDARLHITARVMLRMVMHHFILPARRNGPFLLQMTDLSPSNVFVDDDWNVTSLIDLEWICALPVEMLSVPLWLHNCTIDRITGDNYLAFDKIRQDFLTLMDNEAEHIQAKHDIAIVDIMKQNWNSKAVWFWLGMQSTNAFPVLFQDHILPKFTSNDRLIHQLRDANLTDLWQEGDVGEFVKRKITEEEKYETELQALFDKKGHEPDKNDDKEDRQ